MKIFVAGAGGMLGKAVHQEFSKNHELLCTDIDLNEDWLSHCDVRDWQQCKEVIADFNPDLIVNLSALTDLEYCEKNQENAWLTNALGAENISLIASQRDVPVVYICTAGIFDGAQDVYNDFDAPNPLSIYAKSKYHAELFTQRITSKHYVFRAGWMMGGGPEKDKKFVNKIIKQLKAGATDLYVVDDKLGTPTYTNAFARNILNVVNAEAYGLYNQVCKGEASRHDVAEELLAHFGLTEKIKLHKVDSDHFATEYFAPRPYSEKLVNMKLDQRKLNGMPDWKVALHEYLNEYNWEI